MRIPKELQSALLLLLPLMVLAGPAHGQQAPPVRGSAELESLLAEAAQVRLDLPELGYAWQDDALEGDAKQGGLAVNHNKVIYYFIHWGPIEVPEITEAYVRERIPKIWPSEDLDVQKVEAASVAGHPAIYAEVMPKRTFYRAFFIIWNCPQTGRQFIADMNYNVTVKTPRGELEAELATTRSTLACHPDAPISKLPGHTVHYDNPRYGLSFEHPAHWFVFDSPYGVPHPAYQGIRDHSVGSILAWLQDMEVSLRFEWQAKPETTESAKESMVGRVDLYRFAVKKATELEGFDDFAPEEYEMLRVGPIPALKVTGTAIRSKPDKKGLDLSPRARLMILVAESPEDGRLLCISAQVDYHRKDGLFYPPDRLILDTWAVDLARAMDF